MKIFLRKILFFTAIIFLTVGCSEKPEESKKGFEIIYFNVGEADATLVSCDGHYMMIDCGGDMRTTIAVDNYLQQEGIDYFDYIICSHPHSDHYEGFIKVLQERKYGNVSCSVTDFENSPESFSEFKSSAETFFKKMKAPKVGQTFELGKGDIKAEIKILAVDSVDLKSRSNPSSSDINNSSIVLMISYGNNKFLFTGDVEKAVEKRLVQLHSNGEINLDCDVLKVAHHGSDTSTSDLFLYATSPIYAVFSVKVDPDKEVLDLIDKHNITFFRTDQTGRLTCKSDGDKITFYNDKGAQIS